MASIWSSRSRTKPIRSTRARGVDVENLLQLRQRQLGKRLQAAEQARRLPAFGDRDDALGDVLAEIADPFQVGRNADRADDLAQIVGHRLALGDDDDRLFVDLALTVIEHRIVGDDLLGERRDPN